MLTLMPQFETLMAHTVTTNTRHMRTKTLLLTAALAAAGVVSSSAQVFSVNAVGYVNLALPVGFSMIANPLNGVNNKLDTILPLPDAAEGTEMYRFANGAFGDVITFYGGGVGWFTSNPDPNWTVLNPGEGVFIRPIAAMTITFVGEVPQGTLSNPVSAGFSIRSSQVPQQARLGATGVAGTLNFPAADTDNVYVFNSATQSYKDVYTYYGGTDNFWFSNADADPAGPLIAVGTSFWSQKTTAAAWGRTFSVNN